MDQAMANRAFITKLYVDEAEGTRTLYADIGYSMRMELWDKIQADEWIELSEDCRQNMTGSKDKAQNFFDGIITEMNDRIQRMDIHMRPQMLFNRNFLQERYSDNPISFVHAMATSFEQENQLISHYRNQLESQTSSTDENPSYINDSAITESESSFEVFKYNLQKLAQFKSTNQVCIGGIQTGILPPDDVRQEALDSLQNLIHSLQASREKVMDLMDKALQADAYRNVSLTPKHSISYDDLSAVCDRYAAILHELYTFFHHSDYSLMLKGDRKYQEGEQSLMVLINNFLERSMIFIKHPKEVILVTNNEKKGEKEIKSEATATSTSSKGKKGTKNAPKEKGKAFDTKKKESIDAKIRILGFTKIKGSMVLSHSLILTTEQHLASIESSGKNWEVDGAHSPQPQNCGTIYPTPTELPCNGETEFKNLKIEGYERASDSVYEQMVRLQYKVQVQAFDRTYTLKAYSLPFFLCTGAIQVLELLGSRMWYLANNPDLFHGNFQVITTLPISDVINMLENRIKTTCPKRRRGLSYHGNQFLKERIPEIDSQGKITLHTFIKDKMKVVPDTRNPPEVVEYYKFTFFAWFYAFVKSIESHLGLWHDGVIYDLFSYRDSSEFLLGENYSSGCVILRPGLSKIIKPNSLDAHLRFTVDMKVRYGGKWIVSTIPIDPDTFENSSLYTAVSESKFDDFKPKAICTRKGILSLRVLENYDDRKEINKIRYHGYPIQKVETLSIKSEGTKPDVAAEEELDTGKRKRKEVRHDSTSSFQEPLSAVSSVGPPSAEPYESRPTDTDFCLSADSVSPKSAISDHERQNDSPSNDVNPIKAEFPSSGHIQIYGGQTVDVSHLLQNNNAQSLSTQKSFERHLVTSPYPYQSMDYECPEHQIQPSPEHVAGICVENSPVAIPTTVQEIQDEDQVQDYPNGFMPVNFVYLQGLEPVLHNARGMVPPGWTEGDVMEALTLDQGISL